MKSILSLFNLRLPIYYTYMLQQVEYEPSKFIKWLFRLLRQNKAVKTVMNRQTLVWTSKAKALVLVSYLFVAMSMFLYVFALKDLVFWPICLGVILLATPLYLAYFLWALTLVAHMFIIKPKQIRLVAEANKIFKNHKAVKIAVLGSYGKTTVKELLNTVLSEGKTVASTPGNKNVSVSHARFAKKLTGDEEVIVLEFGEGEPGDIRRMAEMFEPDYAVITGLAPNHLDHYESLQAVAKDLLEIEKFVANDNIYINGDSEMLTDYTKERFVHYSVEGLDGWKVNNVKVSVDATKFVLSKGNKKINVKTSLVGRHQIANLTVVSVIADVLGLTKNQIEKGITSASPFQHRMQPRAINGAWIIDDTYNGNLEGLKAGLDLLKEIKADRKWYVTPGLVDQGDETERVHVELGKKIAEINPDIVVLMQNSVTDTVRSSIEAGGFKGELRIEENPLEFYLNIEHLLAKGDLVLMQNDWTDNYN